MDMFSMMANDIPGYETDTKIYRTNKRIENILEDISDSKDDFKRLSGNLEERKHISSEWNKQYENYKSQLVSAVRTQRAHEKDIADTTTQLEKLEKIKTLSVEVNLEPFSQTNGLLKTLSNELNEFKRLLDDDKTFVEFIKNETNETHLTYKGTLVHVTKAEADLEEERHILETLQEDLVREQEQLQKLTREKNRFMISSRIEKLTELLSIERDQDETDQICESFDTFLGLLEP
jgi:septal ring factor EnvC (AmiA/AmiB activator)